MGEFVIKRDTRKEEFNVEKIKKVINWATTGLDVNPLELESKFNEFIKNGISTRDIHQNLIYHSRILCSPQHPEWSVVAGRLTTMDRWKETQIFEKTFHYYLKEQIDNGIYKHPGLNKWTKNEIIKLGKYIVQERDLEHSYGSVLTAIEKYLTPNECIQQMFMVNAMIIGSVENKDNRLEFTKKVYDAFSLRKLSAATPWLSNLRINNNISSCFIIQVEDDIKSIANGWTNAALISKNGGGLGIDLSKIRAKGSEINGRPNSSKGVTSWSKIFNDIAVGVDQCFYKDTLIQCKDNIKKIFDIDENDYVLTHDGSYKKVSAKIQASSDDLDYYKLNSIIVTGNHPVLVLEYNDIKNLKKSDIIKYLKSNKIYPKWKDVKDINIGDKVLKILDGENK